MKQKCLVVTLTFPIEEGVTLFPENVESEIAHNEGFLNELLEGQFSASASVEEVELPVELLK